MVRARVGVDPRGILILLIGLLIISAVSVTAPSALMVIELNGELHVDPAFMTLATWGWIFSFLGAAMQVVQVPRGIGALMLSGVMGSLICLATVPNFAVFPFGVAVAASLLYHEKEKVTWK